jgi:hypothetical protein
MYKTNSISYPTSQNLPAMRSSLYKNTVNLIPSVLMNGLHEIDLFLG